MTAVLRAALATTSLQRSHPCATLAAAARGPGRRWRQPRVRLIKTAGRGSAVSRT